MQNRLHKTCLLVGYALIASGTLTGCASSNSNQDSGRNWQKHGPFALRLPPTVQWTRNHMKGFDPALPGYHLTGDIATFRLTPADEKPPPVFVLAITTNPSGKPHIDRFRLSVSGVHIECEPFNPQNPPTRITSRNRERNSFQYAEPGTYFSFAIEGNEVHVTLKPTVLKIMQGECFISWIDRYRN